MIGHGGQRLNLVVSSLKIKHKVGFLGGGEQFSKEIPNNRHLPPLTNASPPGPIQSNLWAKVQKQGFWERQTLSPKVNWTPPGRPPAWTTDPVALCSAGSLRLLSFLVPRLEHPVMATLSSSISYWKFWSTYELSAWLTWLPIKVARFSVQSH